MADTYTYTVATLDRVIDTGVVYTVHWRLSASRPNSVEGEPEYFIDVYGTESFEADPSDPGFVDYDDLTEEICVGWVKDKWGEEEVANKEAALSEILDTLETPVNASGTPWETELEIQNR